MITLKIILLLFISLLVSCEDNFKKNKVKSVKNIKNLLPISNRNQAVISLKFHHLFLDRIRVFLDNQLTEKSKLKIVCYGNSITHGFQVMGDNSDLMSYPMTLERYLKKHYQNTDIQVINEGQNGRRSDQALQSIQQVIRHKPDLVFLEFGINDVYSGFTPAYFLNKMQQIIQRFQSENIFIVVLSPTPILTPEQEELKELTKTLHQFCEENQISFINVYEPILHRADTENIELIHIFPDEVHFYGDKYAWLADVIFKAIYKE